MKVKDDKNGFKRIIQYDVLRAIAIICIVLCHSVEAVYSFSINEWVSNDWFSRFFMIVLFTIGRLGVPIFLFLTGALVLKKYIESNSNLFDFYKRKFIPLYLIYLIWIFIYQLFFMVNGNSTIVSLKNILCYMLFLQSIPLPNMWYFPMILEIYLLIPLLSKIIKELSKNLLNIMLMIIYIFFFCFPMIVILLSIFGINIHYIDIFNLSNITYVLYITIGYHLALMKDNNIYNKRQLIVFLLYFFLVLLIEFLSSFTSTDYIYKVWYNCPLLLIASVCIFNIISTIDFSKINKKIISYVEFVSKISLYIFFIHIIFQYFIVKLLDILNLYGIIQVLLIFIMNFSLCVLSGYLLSKIKILSNYLLFIRK